MTLSNRDRMQDKNLSSKLLILTVSIGMSKGMKQFYFLQAKFYDSQDNCIFITYGPFLVTQNPIPGRWTGTHIHAY